MYVCVPPHAVGVELAPVVLQPVSDTHHVRAGVQADGWLCGQQELALQEQTLLLDNQ